MSGMYSSISQYLTCERLDICLFSKMLLTAKDWVDYIVSNIDLLQKLQSSLDYTVFLNTYQVYMKQLSCGM